MSTSAVEQQSPENVKSCCANFYESEAVRFLFGDSFHPGGLALTERLGVVVGLTADSKVLDVASGKGTSAFHLAQKFGCSVIGVDFGKENVRESNERAAQLGLADKVSFIQGDAENLPFGDAEFDAIVCECAYCTFPDKPKAATEFFRVLKTGGRIGLSDLTRQGTLNEDLKTLLGWVACIADAQPLAEYGELLTGGGFKVDVLEPHNDALGEMVNGVRMKLMGAELMVALKKIELPGVDFPKAKQVTQSSVEAINNGTLGYAIVSGVKP